MYKPNDNSASSPHDSSEAGSAKAERPVRASKQERSHVLKPPPMHALDKFDLKILGILQKSADISMNELGQRVGLSHTPCWRRVKQLEDQGYIQKRVALLNPGSLDLHVNVHAYITIKSHDKASLDAFEAAIQGVEEVIECYSTTGEKDYILRLLVKDVETYESLLKNKLVHLPNVGSVNSAFALKQVKYTTEIPVKDYLKVTGA